MSVLLVVNLAPHGSEGPDNALRPADRLATIHDLAETTVRSDRVISF